MFECISGSCVSEPIISYHNCQWVNVPSGSRRKCPYGKVMVGVNSKEFGDHYINRILCCELRIPG
jgi:hypothetical protein